MNILKSTLVSIIILQIMGNTSCNHEGCSTTSRIVPVKSLLEKEKFRISNMLQINTQARFRKYETNQEQRNNVQNYIEKVLSEDSVYYVLLVEIFCTNNKNTSNNIVAFVLFDNCNYESYVNFISTTEFEKVENMAVPKMLNSLMEFVQIEGSKIFLDYFNKEDDDIEIAKSHGALVSELSDNDIKNVSQNPFKYFINRSKYLKVSLKLDKIV